MNCIVLHRVAELVSKQPVVYARDREDATDNSRKLSRDCDVNGIFTLDDKR